MAEDKESSPQAAAVDTVVRELASYAVLFAVSYAVLNRDVMWRLWMRITRKPVSPDEARARRMTADLLRDVSAWEHEHDRTRPVHGDGLYGGR